MQHVGFCGFVSYRRLIKGIADEALVGEFAEKNCPIVVLTLWCFGAC